MIFRISIISILISTIVSCTQAETSNGLKVGAEQTSVYIPLIQGKNVGVVANHSSFINKTHLVDSLLALNISVKKIFSPEHGFRGTQDAGANIKDGKDVKTGLPIISLHGKHRKPTPDHLNGLDIVIFDIQDVGVRFYTYISTMHYVMEACAENNIPVVILDRPNPNGDYVAGPVLDLKFQSFVGMHPIPVVHGMTVGELATMINTEAWLAEGVKCNLTVIPCLNYTHQQKYELPIKPSPNLPNYRSIRLYPSLCFFEPTQVSIGRGTYQPFQVVGYPNNSNGNYSFTPVSIKGMSSSPKHNNVPCKGVNLQATDNYHSFNLELLLSYYKTYPNKEDFFTSEHFFDLLAGSDQLRKQIISGKSIREIEQSWEPALTEFKVLREKYLLYAK